MSRTVDSKKRTCKEEEPPGQKEKQGESTHRGAEAAKGEGGRGSCKVRNHVSSCLANPSAPYNQKNSRSSGGLERETPGVFPKAGPILQQMAFRAAGKSEKNFQQRRNLPEKPFQHSISDSHSYYSGQNEGFGPTVGAKNSDFPSPQKKAL